MKKLTIIFLYIIIYTIVLNQALFSKEKNKIVTAKVIKLEPSRESIIYTRVHIQFKNIYTGLVSLNGYTLCWSDKSKKITLDKPILIKPGEKIIRRVKIYDSIKDKKQIRITPKYEYYSY